MVKYSIPYLVYIIIFGIIPLILTFVIVGVNLSSAIKSSFSIAPPLEIIYNTFFFSLFTAVVSTLLGYIIAITVDMYPKKLLILLILLPFTIPFTASALIWVISFYGGYGWFTYLLGINYDPLYFSKSALFAVSLVSAWSSVPLAFLLILASLRSIPKEIKESSQIDGLTLSQYYFKIAFPYSLKGILLAFLITFVLSMGNFDLPYVMTQGGPGFSTTTLPLIVYFMMFQYDNFSGGALFASILALIASIPAIGVVLLVKSKGFRFSLPAVKIPDKVFRVLMLVVSSIIIIFLDFPVYWMVLVATRPNTLDFLKPPVLIPKEFTLSYVISSLESSVPYIISSVIVSLIVGILTILLSSLGAYEGARKFWFWLLLLSIYLYALPSTSYIIPVYLMTSDLHLINSWIGLALPSAIFTVSFAFWTMFNFYIDFPKVYEEASEIDGMKNKILRLILPLSRPFLIATFVISFTFAWHLLFYPLVLSETPYQMNFPPTGSETATIFALNAISQGSVNWALLASSALVASLPVIIVSYVAQDYMLRGLYSGGIKGA
ncbi:binding-protein-dependent transport systems inner membrane component [Sulfolobus islandicus L.S.2.15]|uniref:Binding-protein-dependent transport systems inner membrane component n=1 Tax=Saccharolobus islandicus (strain L.S.2.15 / Lassen \|nr:ABC transporter permease subunit [Sulfolobus islandicus]ACP36697.1 binding-protein-dependent transport systems inner membrane component [Sulfolobus islandicus L.S.2.15]